MSKLIKREKRTFFLFLESSIGITILIFIVWAQFQGFYNRNELILDCQDPMQVRVENGFPVNKSLKDYGIPTLENIPIIQKTRT